MEDYFIQSPPDQTPQKYLTLIIYDISSQKQRLKMVKLLEGYGYRVQKSAFEAWLTEPLLGELKQAISNLVQEDDHVKIYRLRGAGNTFVWGDMPDFSADEEVMII